MWGAWTPDKVKMAVSGCPRNCAEATIKDFGVVCVESRLRAPFRRRRRHGHQGHRDPLQGDDRGGGAGAWRRLHPALSRAGALSRAHYKWAKRVGIDTVRAPDRRGPRRAAGRLPRASVIRRRFAQVDPWAERVKGVDAHEFRRARRPRRPGGRGMTVALASLDRLGRHRRCSPTSRARRAAWCARHAARSRSSAPPTTSFYAVDNRCPHAAARCPGHRPRRRRHLPAAQLGDQPGDRQGARRRRGLRRGRCR